jgi:hypothetical protein
LLFFSGSKKQRPGLKNKDKSIYLLKVKML